MQERVRYYCPCQEPCGGSPPKSVRSGRKQRQADDPGAVALLAGVNSNLSHNHCYADTEAGNFNVFILYLEINIFQNDSLFDVKFLICYNEVSPTTHFDFTSVGNTHSTAGVFSEYRTNLFQSKSNGVL